LVVGLCRSALQVGKGVDDLAGHTCLGANLKIVARTLSLCSPVLFSGDLNFPHCVMLDTVVHLVLEIG